MHPTSTHWRQNQDRALTTQGFVELSYYLTDPNLRVDGVNPANELTPVSQSNIIINKHPNHVAPFATLEHDLWLLDASRVTIPPTFPENRPFGGFISNVLCDDSGVFDPPISLDMVLANPAVILPGLTIAWGTAFDEYATDFRIIAFSQDENGNEQESACESFTGNQDVITEAHIEMRRTHRIRLEISRWYTGKRRARVGNIFLGINKIYTKDSLLSFSSSHEIDPVSGCLPKYEIAYEVDNRNGDFDPLDKNSVERFVLERQEVTTRYGFRCLQDGNVEWIPGGQYFLSDWVAPHNGLSASFKARDCLGFLDGIYYKGIYTGPIPIVNQGQSGDHLNPGPTWAYSLYDLAEQVLNDAFPNLKDGDEKLWEIHNSLRDIRTISPLPLVTHAQCLQLIANAAGAALTFDRDGILHIAPLPAYRGCVSQTLHDDNSYSRPEVDIDRPLKGVQVSAYSWQVENERTLLYDEYLPLNVGENEFLIHFSDPAVHIWVGCDCRPPDSEYYYYEGLHEVDVEIYTHCAKVVIHRKADERAECRLFARGRVLRQTETIVTKDNPDSDRGETQPLKNTLISSVPHARTVADMLLARYRNRKTASVDWRIDPALDMADFVALGKDDIEICDNRHGTMQVLSTDFRFGGAFIGNSKGMVIQ